MLHSNICKIQCVLHVLQLNVPFPCVTFKSVPKIVEDSYISVCFHVLHLFQPDSYISVCFYVFLLLQTDSYISVCFHMLHLNLCRQLQLYFSCRQHPAAPAETLVNHPVRASNCFPCTAKFDISQL